MVRTASLALAIVLVFSFALSASPPVQKPLTITYCEYIPFYFKGAGGEPRGILVDFWKLWQKKSGVPVSFRFASSWPETIESVRQGKADINAGLFFTKERDRFLDFTRPFYDLPVHLFYKRTAKPPTGLSDLAGKRVGAVTADFNLQYIRNHEPSAVIVEYQSYEAVVKAAIEGKIEAFLMELPVAMTYLAKLDGLGKIGKTAHPIHTNQLRGAVAQGRKELLALINEGLAKVSSEEQQAIVRTWTGQRKATPVEPAVKKVIIAVSIDNVPLHFIDEDGRPTGTLVDLWRLWSKKTGIAIEFKSAPWKDTLAMVGSGEADIHAGCFYSTQRDQYLDYAGVLQDSDTNFFFHESIFGLKSLQDLVGFRIGILAKDFAVEYVNKHLPGAFLSEFPSYEELFDAVERGEIKVFVADVAPALHFLSRRGLLHKFRYHADRPLYSYPFRAAVTEGNSILIEEINRGMRMITPDEISRIQRKYGGARVSQESDALVITCPAWYPPYSMLNPQGKPTGMLIDLWRLWAEKTGKKIEFHASDLSDCLNEIRTGEADIHAGTFRTDGRATWLDFSQPIYPVESVILYPVGRGELHSVSDLAGQKVGAVNGSYQAQYVRTRFPNVEVVTFKRPETAIAAAADGRVRAVVDEFNVASTLINRMGRMGEFRKLNDTLFTMKTRAAVLKGNADLLALVDKGLSAITHKELLEIESRWIADPNLRRFASTKALLRLTAKEEQWLQDHKALRIGVDPEWPPIEFIADDGTYSGMASDYMKLISGRLGIQMGVVKDLTWSQVVEYAKTRKLDAMACATKTPERSKFMLFTRPYISFPAVIMTRTEAPFITDFKDLKGKRVAAVKGYATYEFVAADHPDLDLIEVGSVEQGLRDLSAGRIDAFVATLGTASYTIRKIGLTNIKVAAPTPYSLDLSFAARSDWPELAGIVDKAIRTISQEESDEIYRKWIAVRYEHAVDTAYLRRLFFQIGGAGIFLIGLILLWNRQIRRREERFRGLTEHGMDITQAFDRMGRIVYQSPSHTSILGYKSGELIGTSAYDLFHPDDKAALIKLLDSIPQEAGVTSFVHRWRHKDGRYLYFESNLVNLLHKKALQATVVNSRDITDRRNAQEALKRNLQFLETLLDTIPNPVFFKDAQGKYIGCNEAFATQIFGLPKERFIGRTPYELPEVIPSHLADKYHAADLKLMEERGQQYYEAPVLCADGVTRDFFFNKATYADGRGAIGGIVGVMLDISERKQSEEMRAAELKKFSALYDLAVAMTGEHTLDENLSLVVKQSRSLLGVDIAYIGLRDEEAGELYMHTFSGVESAELKAMRIPFGLGMGGLVTESGQGYICHDYYEEFGPAFHYVARAEGVISGMAAPVQAGQAKLGVLFIFNRTQTSFTQSDLDTLTLLGNLAAVEITRRRAQEELRKARDELELRVKERTRELSRSNELLKREIGQRKLVEADLANELEKFQALYELAVAMTAETSLEEDLALVTEKAKELLRSDASYIALKDEDTGELYMHTLTGIRNEEFKRLRIPPGKGIGGLIAQTREGLIVEDYFREIEPSWHGVVSREGLISFVAVPVELVKHYHGVLFAASRTKVSYSKQDLDTLSLLGNLAALSITRRMSEEALQKANEELELRVQLRTAELLSANEQLQNEINQRKQTEQAIKDSERRLSEIIDFLPDATLVVDEQGTVVAWNRAIEDLSGITAEHMLGKGDYEYSIPFYGERRPVLIDLVRDSDPGIEQKYISIRRDGETLTSESYHSDLRPGGAYLSGKARPLYNAKGELVGAIESIRDVTEQKNAEHSLKLAREQAEEATRAKSEFLANMSHEIRTPMNAIVGLTNLALRCELSVKMQDYLTKIRASSQSLLGIINDILDFSKIEAGKLDLESVDFDLRDVMSLIVDILSPTATDKGIELLVSLGPEVPCALKGDPLRLGQILTNLANNAVKFTHEGGVVVKAATEHTDGQRARIHFSVQDSGIGIPQQKLSALFEPFTQADGSTTRQYGGSGLGLSISRRLVQLMGGELHAWSEVSKGSTFAFSLEFEQRLAAHEPQLASPSDLRGLKVLVVDDNKMAQEILVEMLVAFNFRAFAAGSGPDALEELAQTAQEDPYDLVLMDWKMPGMDGIETARRIDEDPRLEVRIPKIIMVTAFGRDEVRVRAEETGLDAFLVKPVRRSTLFNTIMEVFGKEIAVVDDSPATGDEIKASRKISGARVLVVEDNTINQQVAREILEGAGVEVRIAAHGQQATLAVAQSEFDAVLMDIQMPVMDGYEATRVIRSDPRFDELPIIAMTAHAMKGDREKCLGAGMNDHVTKPINIAELLSALARWVKPRSRMDLLQPAPTTPDRGTVQEELPENLPGIDLPAAIERLGGNTRLLKSLILEFCRDKGGVAEEIRVALQQGNREEARKLAHALKGVAGNLEANALYASSRDLERAIKETDTDLLEDLVKDLAEKLAEVTQAARVIEENEKQPDQTNRTTVQDDEELDVQALTPLISELSSHLKRNSMKAIECLDSVKELLKDSRFRKELEEMEDLVDKLDFNAAQTPLKAISEGLELRV